MKFFKRVHNELGYSLLIVVFAIALITILGTSMLVMSANVMKTTVNERDDQSVYYIAEAGLTETRAEINALATKAFNDVDAEYQAIEDPREKEEFLLEKSFEDRFLETAKNYIDDYLPNNTPIIKEYEKQFDKNTKAEVTVTSTGGYNYTISSIGIIDNKTRTVSQAMTISFGHIISTEEITIGDSSPPANPIFKACSNGVFNSASTSGSVKIEGDVILKKDSTLNLGGDNYGIEGNVYSFGNLSITNSAPIKGNIFSKLGITISNAPIITGQLYASGPITITGSPNVTGDIVSESDISVTNWGTKAKKLIATGKITRPDPNLSVVQYVPINQLPKPIGGVKELNDISQLYKETDCTNIASDEFKPKMPEVIFKPTTTNLPSDTELIEFSDVNKEMHVNEFNYSKYSSVNIKLPESNENAIYSLYLNKLNMNNRDINISGNGKLKIYVKDTLSLGKIVQNNNSKGKKRNNFETTVYYLNDNQRALELSNWGNCKIEANLYVKNANLTNNGCSVNGNIVVLGNNKVTLAGNNTTNGQIFYLPDSDLNASGSVNITGYVIGKNLTGSGNIKISKPSPSDSSNYIDTEIFDKPTSPTTFVVTKYESTTLLLTEEQKEK